MSALEFHICDWLGAWDGTPSGEATLASLRMEAAAENGRVCLTEVFDSISRTVRPHINVSAYALARWLLLNWWRLRWEPARRSDDWLFAHSLAAIGEGYAWPPVVISSDGEFVQVQSSAESACDVAAIRYLTEAEVDIPAADFERGVEHFVEQVLSRLTACRRADRDLRDLYEELAEERSNRKLAGTCRLQARAGFDPGEAPRGWQEEMDELRRAVGPEAIGELAATLPMLRDGLRTVRNGMNSLMQSPHEIDLEWLKAPARGVRGELPWQRGARLAVWVRQQLGLKSGPFANARLAECIGAEMPMPFSGRCALHGAFRIDKSGKTRIAVPSDRVENQRFHLARVMAGALLASADDHLLAVTDAGTAMQKCERSFAQELLCPWDDLDTFTNEHGLGEDAIADAADYFQVSEWTILSALVNKRKLPRERLPLALR
jgi:hypothetical protein